MRFYRFVTWEPSFEGFLRLEAMRPREKSSPRGQTIITNFLVISIANTHTDTVRTQFEALDPLKKVGTTAKSLRAAVFNA